MENWDEIRTAFQVARIGTVSGAAEHLGVHHATVIRHIDALERRLGVKLFQRHARGYTPTEAGLDLLQVARATDDQFNQLAAKLKGRGTEVAGEIVVTSLASIVPWVVPALAAFQRAHPGVILRYLTGERLFRLEYGEAHLAIRAGSAPEEPDNVVQHFRNVEIAAFANKDYVAEHGIPTGPEDHARHRFVAGDDADSRAPFEKWLRANVPAEAITFRASDTEATNAAVRAGAGIGFMVAPEGRADPSLVEIYGPRAEWSAPLWLVTHVDLHRTTKVQALLRFLKRHRQEGGG